MCPGSLREEEATSRISQSDTGCSETSQELWEILPYLVIHHHLLGSHFGDGQ